MATNYVLTRPAYVGYMTTASGRTYGTGSGTASAAVAACTSLGSCRELNLELTGETYTATSNNYNDAVVAAAYGGFNAVLTMQLEEITGSAMKLMFAGGSGNTSGIFFDGSATTPTDYSIFSTPWYIDGSAYAMCCTKCNIIPGATKRLGKEQEILELKFNVLVDVSSSAVTGRKWVHFLEYVA